MEKVDVERAETDFLRRVRGGGRGGVGGGWVCGEEGGAEAFFALGVDTGGDRFEVFDCGEDGELLGDCEDGGWFCGVLA